MHAMYCNHDNIKYMVLKDIFIIEALKLSKFLLLLPSTGQLKENWTLWLLKDIKAFPSKLLFVFFFIYIYFSQRMSRILKHGHKKLIKHHKHVICVQWTLQMIMWWCVHIVILICTQEVLLRKIGPKSIHKWKWLGLSSNGENLGSYKILRAAPEKLHV